MRLISLYFIIIAQANVIDVRLPIMHTISFNIWFDDSNAPMHEFHFSLDLRDPVEHHGLTEREDIIQ